jgi:hypothetical protein
LSEEWKPNLSGVLEGDYETAAQPGGEVLFKGKLNVKSGIVQNLHLLNLISDFTHTDRFRRIVWDEAHADVETRGTRTQVSKLVLQSNGLIRIEGNLTLQGTALGGMFLVGVSPETLRWMPGAQNHVFTESNPSGQAGFVWTTVRVSGVPGAIKEDLSRRLLVALGREVIDLPLHVAGKGAEVLTKTGGEVLKQGSEVLKNGAGTVIETGVDILKDTLKGGIPLLPR